MGRTLMIIGPTRVPALITVVFGCGCKGASRLCCVNLPMTPDSFDRPPSPYAVPRETEPESGRG